MDGCSARATPAKDALSNARVYVALGKDVGKNKGTLDWCLQKFRGGNIVILHVHQPLQRNSHGSNNEVVDSERARAYKRPEEMEMAETMQNYIQRCASSKAHIENVLLESSDIKIGILELILKHNINKLVMGTKSYKKLSRSKRTPTSSKAEYVMENAPPSLTVFFVYKGKLLYTHESSTPGPLSLTHPEFTKFSPTELRKATNRFSSRSVLGMVRGPLGTVYKGLLTNMDVAIKTLNSQADILEMDFIREVNNLSQVKHKHLVRLIGACIEYPSYSLVYEYLPNGNLEDRLNCKHNVLPLTWRDRIVIVAETCCALLSLHSFGIVHANLKPTNVLLDSKLEVKVGDYGLMTFMDYQLSFSGSYSQIMSPYMDPVFLVGGVITPSADVYSLGIIILQLLTGRSPVFIRKAVHEAVSGGNLAAILDRTAGDWPLPQAEQLVNLGLKCCMPCGEARPDLETDVWMILGPMRASLMDSVPQYFKCPISKKTRQYEGKALERWMEAGLTTSPMTGKELNHLNFLPNFTLSSVIQDWLRQL